jgi:putative acetyltransferase
MMIRPERAGDIAAIRGVIRAAFAGTQEADLVDRLRNDNDLLASLVAEQDGIIIGHVGFSWLPGVSLAPLAVMQEHRRRGVGRALTEAGHLQLRNCGESIVFVLGAPEYYGRLGYSVTSASGFESIYAGCHFQALPLSLPAPETGSLTYPRAFGGLGQIA